jgi:nucleoside phosphorylase
VTYTVKLVWKVFGRLADDVRPYEESSGSNSDRPRDPSELLFNVTTGKSFLRDIGGDAKSTFVPLVLSPTHVFYNALRPTVAQAQLSLQGKKFPLELNLVSPQEAVRANFSISAFERSICVSIQTDEFTVEDPTSLATLQLIDTHPGLVAVTKKVLAMAETRSKYQDGRNGGLKCFPCVQIVASSDTKDLSPNFLTRLITRHDGANELLTKSQEHKNKPHAIDSTTLFCDRQGVVAFVPASASDKERGGMRRRFKSATAMLELAAALQRLLTANDPLSKLKLDAIDSLVNDSDSVFANSTSGHIVWNLFLQEFKLPAALAARMKKQTLSNVNSEAKTTVLCMAAATVEFKTVSGLLEHNFGPATKHKLGEAKNYDVILSYVDKDKDVRWCLAPQLSQGITSAALDVQRVADGLRPDIVLMVGMCMGMPDKKLAPGTVIVPNSITLLDHQRYKDSATEYRPRGDSVASGLHNVARIASLDALPFKVIVDKGLACASVKIEDTQTGLVPFIATYLPDVVAFDMEGWGFYQGTVKYQCLWIKAVADSGERQGDTEGLRSVKQESQADATKNAFQFASKVVDHYSELISP